MATYGEEVLGKRIELAFDEGDFYPGTIDKITSQLEAGKIVRKHRIEPGKGYFARQADSRGGCSKTRKKLRAHAGKYPTDPAVSFWVKTDSWEPPDKAHLDAVMALLKKLI